MDRVEIPVSLEVLADGIVGSAYFLSYSEIKDFILQIDAGIADTEFTELLIEALRDSLEE